MTLPDLFIRGLIAHLIADFFLQNQWMSDNKTNLLHPAAWVHSGIHFLAYLFVFPVWVAALLFAAHLLIDTRVPLQWWRKVYRQAAPPAVFPAFAMWQDQAAHIICLYYACRLIAV